MVLHELKQRHVEAFAVIMRPIYLGEPPLPVAMFRGEVVRAAVSAGWFKSPEMTIADVGELETKQVYWLSEKFTSAYVEAMAVDPKA